MKLLFRSLLLMAALFGLVFAVADAYLARHGVPMWQGLLFAVVCIGLQYWLGPSVIQWVLRIRWDDSRTELPARNREFLEALCTERGLEMPRIGIIDSATPNAFTFGHVPSDARIVVTTGLLAALTPEESNAVLAHEMGHVEHYDFIVMTLAALAPLLLYQLYAFTRYASKTRAVAIGAYLAYWVSQYIVLMLSRTREYFADEYSARVTRTPDALASALVKIAYGIFQADGALVEAMAAGSDKEKAALQRERTRLCSLALMGISNIDAGQSLALTGGDGAGSAAIMRWDLENPWARVYELSSTHPLTALRIRALNRESEAMHLPVTHPVPAANRMRSRTLPLEVLLWAAPWICGTGTLIAAGLRHGEFAISPTLAPTLLMLTGVTWMLRTWMRYYGRFEPATIRDLMEDVEVSPMRPRAARIEGMIVGFGVPGAFWCADLVIRDETGLLFMLYKQSIPLARLMFAVTEANKYIGQRVVIEGWFRRSLHPYIEMGRLTGEDGKSHIAWSRWVHHGAAAALAATGAIWFSML